MDLLDCVMKINGECFRFKTEFLQRNIFRHKSVETIIVQGQKSQAFSTKLLNKRKKLLNFQLKNPLSSQNLPKTAKIRMKNNKSRAVPDTSWCAMSNHQTTTIEK